MTRRMVRGVIVGASTLLGKDLVEELNDGASTAWDLTLVDTAEAAGQVAAAGDEAAVILPISEDSFTGMDIVFFAGDAATVRKYGKAAHTAGAAIVDLTGTMESGPGVLLRSPLLRAAGAPDLATVAVRVAHPAALMLAAVAQRLEPFGLQRIAATVLEPASAQGSAGVDEMHQQTVALLSFKPLERDVFDGQVAFNLRAALGEAAKVNLAATAARIGREAAELAGGGTAAQLAVQVLQAPVFHASTASLFVELAATPGESAVGQALDGAGVHVVSGEESASNDGVSGKGEIIVMLRAAEIFGGAEKAPGSAFWLWMAADNLRLVARTAGSCAAELAALRPTPEVN